MKRKKSALPRAETAPKRTTLRTAADDDERIEVILSAVPDDPVAWYWELRLPSGTHAKGRASAFALATAAGWKAWNKYMAQARQLLLKSAEGAG